MYSEHFSDGNAARVRRKIGGGDGVRISSDAFFLHRKTTYSKFRRLPGALFGKVDLKTKESRLSVGSFGQNEPETAFIEKVNFAFVRQTLG